MPGISGTAPLNAARSTFHSKKRSTTTSIGFSLLTGGTMRSTEQSGKPTYCSHQSRWASSRCLRTASRSCVVARTPFSQAMTLSGSVTPASLRAAIPAAMAPAMRGSTVSPTAVVTSSAPAIWAASSGLRESIAEMSVMRICSQTVSMI